VVCELVSHTITVALYCCVFGTFIMSWWLTRTYQGIDLNF